ncbi:hypothetical protein PR202_gb27342 [Eleusine coracana subsp. coracana]|uniref:DUF7769 domain-containing protein n=1 Tax=Eleusine coracana subsp. coracana TaxID=191504 RepID=A0AAV5FTI4_ELECO|nr:hypothetical protein PR202_gb27342 [Eleusine coracana subsp. coracana]
MAPVDLNLPPDLEVNEPAYWSAIGDWNGPAYELDYDMMWDGDEDEGATQDEVFGEGGEDQVPGQAFDLNLATDGDVIDEGLSHGGEHVFDLNLVFMKINVLSIGTNRRRRFYPNKLKFAIYAELLARTDPPILRRGVTREVANRFDVPLSKTFGIMASLVV